MWPNDIGRRVIGDMCIRRIRLESGRASCWADENTTPQRDAFTVQTARVSITRDELQP